MVGLVLLRHKNINSLTISNSEILSKIYEAKNDIIGNITSQSSALKNSNTIIRTKIEEVIKQNNQIENKVDSLKTFIIIGLILIILLLLYIAFGE